MSYIDIGEQVRIRINADNAQLVSVQRDGREFMHGGGKQAADKTVLDTQGWQQSELIMFPIVGPAEHGVLHVGAVRVQLGQHGFARHAHWRVQHTAAGVECVLEHAAQQVYANTKTVSDSEPAHLTWPWGVRLTKIYSVQGNAVLLQLRITNCTAQPMLFQCGWHPAFRIDEQAQITVADTTYSMQDIAAVSAQQSACRVNATAATLHTAHGALHFTSNFGALMLWRPGAAPMLCIEPVTHLQQHALQSLHAENAVQLQGHSSIDYFARIEFI